LVLSLTLYAFRTVCITPEYTKNTDVLQVL
jgi:hypothetical protein